MRVFVALVPPAAVLAELADAVGPVRSAYPGLRWTPPAQWHLTLAFLGEIDEAVLPELTERLGRVARRHAPLSLAFAGGGRFGDRVLWTRVRGTSVVGGVDDRPAPPYGPASPDAPGPRESSVPVRRVERSGTASRVFVPGESSISARRVEHLGSAGGASRHEPRAEGQALRRLAASVTAAARRCRIDVDERPYRPHLTLARGRTGSDLRPAVAALTDFAGSAWTADALHLVRSRLGAGPGGTATHEIVETWPLSR